MGAQRHRDRVESGHVDTDGTILRLVRHPRAADSTAHLNKCACQLRQAVGLDQLEAERRLKSDSKFVQAWSLLQNLERGSDDEASVERSLRARTRILIDAHYVGQKVSVPWEVAQEAIEKVKWYRQAL